MMSSDSSTEEDHSSPQKPRKMLATRRRVGRGVPQQRTMIYTNRVNAMMQAPLPKPPDTWSSPPTGGSASEIVKSDKENCPRRSPCAVIRSLDQELVVSDEDAGEERARSPTPPQVTLDDVMPRYRGRKKRKTKKEKQTESLLRNVDTMLCKYKVNKQLGENYLNLSGDMERSPTQQQRSATASSKVIAVKVRRGTSVMRFSMRRTESFAALSRMVSERLTVDVGSIMLTLNDARVKMTDSPECVGLTIADILECLIVEPDVISKTSSLEENAKEKGLIEVKFQGCASKDTIQLRINKKCEFGEVFTSYIEKVGLKGGSVKFIFDGDALSPDETPEDVDIDDGDIIDVIPVVT